MSKLQKWAPLWGEYPDYVWMPNSADVKKLIGGNVDADWITNTCAVRLSRTLNYNSIRVPSNFAGLTTVRGGDGRRYAIRVREMRKWLRHALGDPELDIQKKASTDFDKSQLAGKRGIIAFDIKFSDATGHLDLWTGSSFSSEAMTTKDYWTAATRVTLWQAID